MFMGFGGLYMNGFLMYYSCSMAGTWVGAWGDVEVACSFGAIVQLFDVFTCMSL